MHADFGAIRADVDVEEGKDVEQQADFGIFYSTNGGKVIILYIYRIFMYKINDLMYLKMTVLSVWRGLG